MTLSHRRPASLTCSSLVNCFFLVCSGKDKNHDASVLDVDCCLDNFRCRRESEVFFLESMEGMLRPLRSASEPFRVLGTERSLMAFVRELCAKRSRSKVEKYCRSNSQQSSLTYWIGGK